MPCGDLMSSAAVVEVLPVRVGRFGRALPSATVELLRSLDLDFIIRFGFGILRGDVLHASRSGVWSFHHDDERQIRGGPPGFWEVFAGLDTSGVLLQRLTHSLDAGEVIERRIFATIKHSYPRNRDRVNLASVDMIGLAARRLRFREPHPAFVPSNDERMLGPILKDPSNAQMSVFVARQSLRIVRAAWTGIMRADTWAISLDGNWLPEMVTNGYLADPFLVERDGRLVMLVEEFDEATARGRISVLESVDGAWTLTSNVMPQDVHLSYPMVVESGGDLFCVPETWQSNAVQLWKCTSFPDRWSPVSPLVTDVQLVDPTLFRHGGKWWLLGSVRSESTNAGLSAWIADRIEGPYIAHQFNPIKVDVGSSRPAGAPYVDDGILYRPSQDCSSSYGAAVVVNRVETLDDSGLVEYPVDRIEHANGPYRSGCHTVNRTGGPVPHIVVDGRRYRLSSARARREVVARLLRRRER